MIRTIPPSGALDVMAGIYGGGRLMSGLRLAGIASGVDTNALIDS